MVQLHCGDCLSVLPTLEEASVDAVVCDPPYALTSQVATRRSCFPGRSCVTAGEARGFMGKGWDGSLPGVEHWRAVLRVLKPAHYLLAFGGTRTHHRLMCAIEDAGFEIRDVINWLHGQGFPKGKGNLKPAWEPVILARRPGPRVLPLQIDACRVEGEVPQVTQGITRRAAEGQAIYGGDHDIRRDRRRSNPSPAGRYPANLIHDGSEEVLEAFAAFGESKSSSRRVKHAAATMGYGGAARDFVTGGHDDTGTAARFFYCAKASRSERGEGNTHPTVKPLALMRYLCRLITPPGGTSLILDPFLGSGTTGVAALQEGFGFVGIEREPPYFAIAQRRIAEAEAEQRSSLFAPGKE